MSFLQKIPSMTYHVIVLQAAFSSHCETVMPRNQRVLCWVQPILAVPKVPQLVIRVPCGSFWRVATANDARALNKRVYFSDLLYSLVSRAQPRCQAQQCIGYCSEL